jgi:hypothetical protein
LLFPLRKHPGHLVERLCFNSGSVRFLATCLVCALLAAAVLTGCPQDETSVAVDSGPPKHDAIAKCVIAVGQVQIKRRGGDWVDVVDASPLCPREI